MATDLSFVEYVTDQAQLGDRLTYNKMFGEYGLYLDGKIVALACDNTLYVKQTTSTDSLTANLVRSSPYPGAKPHVVADALLDEPEQLCELLLATGKALSALKPKAPNKKKP